MANGTRRCAFKEGKRRCARNGFGNPPLCRAHAIQVRLHGEQGEHTDSPFYELIDLADRAISQSGNQFVQQARELFGEFLSQSANKTNAQRYDWTPAREEPPPDPPPPPPKEDPRDVLGFPPGAVPTRAQIKARQRELAKLFHPDKGGSLAAMQRVNDAASALLSLLAAKTG